MSVQAQTGQTAQIPLQFDFLNPGARSLGIGSAFIAVADDATSALTNPAGLTLLGRPEISAELRFRDLDTRYLAGGRLSGTVTGVGVDTLDGPVYRTSVDRSLRPYFLSAVVPAGRWSLAAYRHELVLQENTFLSEGPFQQTFAGGVPVNNARNLGLAGDRRIAVDNYGGAVAVRVSDRVALGAGLSVYRFTTDSAFGALGFESGLFSPVNPASRGTNSATVQTGVQTRTAANLGALVTLTPRVTAGLVYRQGASFSFRQTSLVPGTVGLEDIGQFRTPSLVGGGLRIQLTNRLSTAFDYNRIAYSRLKSDFVALQVAPSVVDRVSVPDGNEYHVGVEYTLASLSWMPSFRGGLWYDPKHTIEYASDGSESPEDVRMRATFPGGENVIHYTFGIGMPLSRALELNAGVDVTERRRYGAVSLVFRFGG